MANVKKEHKEKCLDPSLLSGSTENKKVTATRKSHTTPENFNVLRENLWYSPEETDSFKNRPESVTSDGQPVAAIITDITVQTDIELYSLCI